MTSYHPGTALIQWGANNGANQHWKLTASGGGFVITNSASTLAVDAAANTQNTNIQQITSNGGSAQMWLIH